MCETKFKDKLKSLLEPLENYMLHDKSIKINILFGSGINFNLTKNALSWFDLSKNSLFNYLKKENNNDNNNFTNKALTNELLKVINNKKLLLSISEKNIKWTNLEIIWENFTYKFKNDLEMLMDKFQTFILTLNYDKTIEKIINKESINLLEEENSKDNSKINHMHGIVSDDGNFEGLKLLTLNDYINNYEKSKKIFKDLFTKQEKEEIPEYVFIFGTSMTEEHILAAFKNIENNNNITIIYFVYFPNDDIYLKIKNIYRKINITTINYNFQDDLDKQSDDFKNAWKLFSKSLLEINNLKNNLDNEFIDNKKFIDKLKNTNLLQNTNFQSFNNNKKRQILILMKRRDKITIDEYLLYYEHVPNIIN